MTECERVAKDDYQLLTMINSGSYSEVWDVLNTKTGIIMAAKQMTGYPTLAGREAEIMRALKEDPHWFVVHLHDTFRERGTNTLVMDLMACDLKHWVLKFRPEGVTLNDVCVLTSRLLGALQFIGEKGVLHGDLKPENLLLASPSKPHTLKLGDFGLADKGLSEDDAVDWSYYGTVEHTCPEIIMGYPSKWVFSSDMWAAGCVLLFTVLRVNPFETISSDENEQIQMQNTLRKICRQMGKPPSHMLKNSTKQTCCQLLEEDLEIQPMLPSKCPLTEKLVSVLTQGGSVVYTSKMTEFCSLMNRMLCLDPDHRLRPAQGLSDPFIANSY